jgi:flagellar protein FliO/FliZ
MSSIALLQAFGALVFVVILMFVGAWIFRKIGGLPAVKKNPIKVISGVRLGAREKVVVLEIADTWLVVGVANGQVNTLHTLPRQITMTEGNATPQKSSFSQWLSTFSAKPKPRKRF